VYKLVTIIFSHYNEKARWGLDYFAQAYQEDGYMPFLHAPAVALATRGSSDASGDRVSTRLSTPVMVCPDGERICDSSRILHYLDERHGREVSLYESPEAEALEKEWHDGLGAHSRRLAYYYMLDDTRLMRRVAHQNVGLRQALLFRAAFPLGRALLKRSLGIDERRAQRSKDMVLEAFAGASSRLADGRPYFCGDHFSAADLSFACMAVPSLLITKEEGFGAYFPPMNEAPTPAQRLAQQLRDTPAGRHALRMFAEHRAPL